MDELKKLYAIYGELSVKAEVLNNQINAVKSQINEQLKTLEAQQSQGDAKPEPKKDK